MKLFADNDDECVRIDITIRLPDEIGAPLQRWAEIENRSVEDLALDVQANSVEADHCFPTAEEVVARIQATPPNMADYLLDSNHASPPATIGRP